MRSWRWSLRSSGSAPNLSSLMKSFLPLEVNQKLCIAVSHDENNAKGEIRTTREIPYLHQFSKIYGLLEKQKNLRRRHPSVPLVLPYFHRKLLSFLLRGWGDLWEVLCQLLDSGLLQKVPQEEGEGEEVQKEGQGRVSAGDVYCAFQFNVAL